MLRSIPFHPNMNLNLSFSIFAISYIRRWTRLRNVNTLENLMRTGTELLSEISATTIFTSFNFHIIRFSYFRFSGKGEVDVYHMRMCFIVSIPCHGIRPSRHQGRFRHQPTRHRETITPPTNSPPNKVVEVN